MHTSHSAAEVAPGKPRVFMLRLLVIFQVASLVADPDVYSKLDS